MSDLDTISKRYEKALGSQRDSKSILTQARARFAEKLHGVDTPAPSRWRFVVPAFGLVAAAAVLTFVFFPEAPLGVTLRGQPDQPVDFVQAAASTEEVVDFSDGSEVRVRGSSQMRILGVTPEGAQVSLERGAAHVAVVHRQKTKWVFSAGPYRVHVVGTQFELKWNPETGGLEVEMDDGIVEVDGPGLARQRVTSRQKLEAFAEPASASLYLEPLTPDPAETASVTRRRPRVQKEQPVAVEKPAEKPVVLGASWRYLADKGDAVGAMNAAEQAGFTWLANSMPRGDVLVLGDVARKAKQPARAMEAWLAVRARFGGTVGASEAALRLGHLAEDQRDVDEAVRWYSEAAREAPNAATAPEALGDWLGVLVRAERTADAKKIAGEYLKRFKNGPDAPAARAVLAK
ncbi:MAG: tetratricopeptide repeat protein [Archangium sp.]|nr:tetratricopeptide repeat protein [Archangium sp.]